MKTLLKIAGALLICSSAYAQTQISGSGVQIGGSVVGGAGAVTNLCSAVTLSTGWTCDTATGLIKVSTGTPATLTISTIAAGYTTFQIYVSGSSTAATGANVDLQFNGDNSNAYEWLSVVASNITAPANSATIGDTAMKNMCMISAPGPGGAFASGGVITIQNMNAGNNWTHVTSLCTGRDNLIHNFWESSSGAWHPTFAINSITLIADSTSFAANTVFTIYGIQ